MITQHEIRRGVYYDSVVLMQLQRALVALPHVLDAAVVMATPANREILAATGFSTTDIDAAPEDLLIIVKADDAATARAALAQVDELLKQRRSTSTPSGTYRPRSLRAAVSALPDAHWVLVSVPGRYAAGVAQQALDMGKHVFLYSDNVALADEIALKGAARDKGLLLMGPDCGTAIVNGIGLGFANRVRRGGIGVVAAAGTGLQAITCRVHELGAGISQAFGTGSRDLRVEVGGITALQALDLLSRDPQTKVIVLVSKPPAADVVTKLLSAAQTIRKPVVVDFIGYPPPARQLGNLHFVVSLDEAAQLAVELMETDRSGRLTAADGRSPVTGYLRGLFSGGTLAVQALLSLQPTLSPLYSNVPLRPDQALADSWRSQAHTILDLGEDEFTQGRLHPMLDNDLRLRRLRQEAADPEVGLILLDVVLGEGAHPDPAGELAPAIAQVKGARAELEVVAIVVGTDQDPQKTATQSNRLAEAGASVFRTTADAMAYVNERLKRSARYDYPPLPLQHFGDTLAAINVGLEAFYDSLIAQGAAAIHIDWRPPAAGNEAMMALLARMKAGNRPEGETS